MRTRDAQVFDENGEVRNIVVIDPEHFQVGQVWKPGVRVELVTVEVESRQLFQSIQTSQVS